MVEAVVTVTPLVPLAFTDAGLNVTVNPAGVFTDVRLTLPVKGATRVTVRIRAPLVAPVVVDIGEGLTLIVNDPTDAACTVSARVCVTLVAPFALAVITTLAFPVVAVDEAVSVSVPVVEPSAMDSAPAVTPVGRPVALIVTAPAEPVLEIVTLTLPAAPCVIVRLDGERPRVIEMGEVPVSVVLLQAETAAATASARHFVKSDWLLRVFIRPFRTGCW